MKIAILGGAFNPIHKGHIALAEAAKTSFGLNKVIFIPVYIPPHKPDEEFASAEDRLAMVELAISDNDSFRVSRLEINRRKISYSVDTVAYIKKIYPRDTELFFLTGSDSAAGLDSWKDIDKIFSMCRFIVGIRPEYTFEIKHKNIEIMPMVPVDISSTNIRQALRENKDIKEFVTEKVAAYILKNNLYR